MSLTRFVPIGLSLFGIFLADYDILGITRI